MNTLTTQKRIESIDVVRGIVMIVMALDHTRDYFHIGANLDDPLNLATTTPLLYFTRWITHFCAPIFVFLSGVSVYLQSQRKTKKELGVFVIKRGLWLIFAEWSIIALAWTFNPFFNVFPFQVIWAIGISMVILGLLIVVNTPGAVIFIAGIIIVLAHNLLDIPESAPGFAPTFWWDLLHHGVFKPYEIIPKHYAILVYPFAAWTGLMLVGYSCGILFTSAFAPQRRRTWLLFSGCGLILFFVVLRFANFYGDPVPWSPQPTVFYTFLSFIKINKYPPSLLYLCLTIGPALLLLAFMENIKNVFTDVMVVYGRTAFFYYIIHIYVIHLIATICFFARGHTLADAANVGEKYPFLFIAPGEGYRLATVYFVWAVVVVGMYPLCKWYDAYKRNHREKWWLSYL